MIAGDWWCRSAIAAFSRTGDHARHRPRAGEDRCRVRLDDARECAAACPHAGGTPAAVLSWHNWRGKESALCALAEERSLVGVPNRGPRRPQDESLVADFFVQHQLVINEIYCALKYGALPLASSSFAGGTSMSPLASGLRLIPDGYVELQTPSGIIACFLEVDLGNETMTVWKEKIGNYLQLALSGDCERMFHESRFRVLVIANSGAAVVVDPQGRRGFDRKNLLVCKSGGNSQERLLCLRVGPSHGDEAQPLIPTP